MSLYRKVLLGTGAVMVAAALVGLMLPRHVRVERAIVIDAPGPAVHEVLNSFRQFNEWSPWASLDPGAKYTLDGPPSGVGAKLSWVGDPATLGSGRQEIIESRSPDLVRMAIDFGPTRATGTFTLTPEGSGTRVVWTLETDLGMNPVSRYFGRMLDGMIGGDFERGLQGLKRFVEKQG